jgi:hypothetical protein
MSNLSKNYYVNVGPLGTFNPSGNAAYNTTPEDIDVIFETLEIQKKTHLLLYFHGGLVSAENGIKTAEYVTPTILSENDPVNTVDNSIHPVSFIWETDLLSIIKANFSQVSDTDFFKKLLEKIVKVAGEKLGIDVESNGGSRGISTFSYEEIKEELEKDAPFEKYKIDEGSRSSNITTYNDRFLQDEIEASIEIEFSIDPDFNANLFEQLSSAEYQLIKKENTANILSPGSRGILSLAKLIKAAVTVIFKIIKRHVNKRDHGFYPTIIEEILREIYIADVGTWAWGEMKNKAEQMWLPDNDNVTGLDCHAGFYFLVKLKEFASRNNNITVDLVGHSAGSIAICYFMREFVKMNINVQLRHLFFLAPACRSDLFRDMIIKNKDKFKHFRMFTMSDENEIKDRCIPGLYTRSLLYMISGILEKDEFDAYILGMQRFQLNATPFENDHLLNEIIDFMKLEKNRIIYAATDEAALEGFRCKSLQHGGFATDAVETIKSIAFTLKNL